MMRPEDLLDLQGAGEVEVLFTDLPMWCTSWHSIKTRLVLSARRCVPPVGPGTLSVRGKGHFGRQIGRFGRGKHVERHAVGSGGGAHQRSL